MYVTSVFAFRVRHLLMRENNLLGTRDLSHLRSGFSSLSGRPMFFKCLINSEMMIFLKGRPFSFESSFKNTKYMN